jgi:hypothetical protein
MTSRRSSRLARRLLSRRLRGALLLGAVAFFGCGETPSVEVSTFVGPSHARRDPELKAKAAREILTALLPAQPADAPAVDEAPEIAVHPPTNTRELDGLVGAIETGSLSDLQGPAGRIAAAGPEVWPRIAELLSADLAGPKGDYVSILRAIGGDVPNRYGHFALRWKKAHGHDVKLSDDWFRDLLALPRAKVSSGLREVYRDAILRTALFRAAASAAQDPDLASDVVSALLDAAFVHDGLFRDEIARAIESIGDPAIPQLVASSIVPPHDKRHDLVTWVMRPRFAEAMLDRMDRLHPSRAVESASRDPELLARVLSAYGVALRGEAAQEVLRYVDAPAPGVRAAARVAWLSYVAGPAPKGNSRTVKLLGGGTAHRQAFLTYRERARLAIMAELSGRAPELLEAPCEERRENGSIDLACEAQPLRLTLAYFERLDRARAAAQAEALEDALASSDADEGVRKIDQLLAGDGEIGEPARVAAFLEQVGRSAVAEGRLARAAQLFRKAAMLCVRHDAEMSRRLRVQALLAEASVEGLGEDGRAMLLRTAAALEPEDTRIQRALAAIQPARASTKAASDPPLLFGAALVALALVCLSVIGRRLRAASASP